MLCAFYWSKQLLLESLFIDWSLPDMLHVKGRPYWQILLILNMKPFINECEGIISSAKYVLMYQGRPPLQL